MTKIKKDILESLATEAMEIGMNTRKISVQSRPGASLLQYLERTVPKFSKSAVCRDALESGLDERYPELWAEVEQLMPDSARDRYSWDWQAPKLKKEVFTEVREYMESRRSRAVISVYSPRVAVLTEYLRQTEPGISISEVCREIIEREFQEKLPEMWKEVEKL